LAATSAAAEDDDQDDGPAVVRPAISRSGSTKLKKKASSSRLSFGVTDPAGDGEGADNSRQPVTPKKTSTLSQRTTENKALRSSFSNHKLPTRSFGPEVEETSYSKEYLEELQSSTPNTPQNIASLCIHDDDTELGPGTADGGSGDAMDLDPSELQGAVVVPQAELSMSAFGTGTGSYIPSAVEIREKKERRARLAAEGDAYDEDDDDNYISLVPKKKKDETRLIAEDEDLGEGYDEFVEDARLELSKQGEREAARRHRREMADLINAAEAGGSDGEDGGEDADSDAERTAAYEAAQTRAAMGGYHLTANEGASRGGGGTTGLVIPRMRALPNLGESLARMQGLVQGVEEQAAAKRRRIEALERERQEIIAREAEVQKVLNQAGVKYQSALGVKQESVVDPLKLAAESPLRAAAGAATTILPAERGLESFGTPSRRQEYDEEMAD
jgi:hypothetical protein